MTLSTLLKFNLRYYRRHSLLALLCLLGIALGVGVVVAVQLINNSALTSFSSYVDLLSGRATHSIVSRYSRIDERVFSGIWSDPRVKSASPLIEVVADVVELDNGPLRFLGIDPFLDGDLRNLAPAGENEASFREFLTEDPPGVYLSPRLVEKYRLKPGDRLTVLTAGIEKKVTVLGSFPTHGNVAQEENLAVMDISAAQEVFGRLGRLDRIDIILRSAPEEFQRDLPAGLELTDSGSRKSALEALLYSFQLNLAAMSLLALFVGTFLIYNFSMFSVLSRREDMSLLLTLGSDQRGLVGAFLTESFFLGACGSLIGIPFGFLVAWLSIGKVSATITDIYFYVRVESVSLTLPVLLSGLGVGFLATVVGTGLPALEVAFTPPILGMKRRTIEDRAHAIKGLLLIFGLLCFVGSLAASWASRFSIFWGFVAAFGMTIAFAFFTPSFLSLVTHYLGLAIRRICGSLTGFMAARTIRASLSRTSMAVAALAVALSMTIGIDTMIHSFRESVANWLDGSLQGDLYISPATTKWDHPLPDALITELQNDPRVEAVERYATHDIYLDSRPVRLRVIDGEVLERHSRFLFLSGGNGAWKRFRDGGLFISESLAYKFRLEVGQSVSLTTPSGIQSFPVVAVVRDYSSDQGAMQIDRKIYEIMWQDGRVQSLALFLKPDASAGAVRKSIVDQFPGLDRTIVSNTGMKANALHIFDQTFAPTATLKGVSLLVALLGVATALTAILVERTGEMEVLALLGLTPQELGRINIYQALIMGLVSFLISICCGLILTYIIIYAINYRSFGWSIDVFLDPWVFGKVSLLTVIACLAASIYPTYRLLQRPPTVRVEDE
jgi:putative ABC transport system permease protein